MRSFYYYVIPAVLVFVLAGYGIYQLYRSKVEEKPIPTPSPLSSPVGFPTSPTPKVSPSPVLGTGTGTVTPSTQPEAGFNTREYPPNYTR